MKLIPLDAVLAEIEKRIKVLQENPYENHKTICHLDSLKQSINSLEVKEVDLNEYYHDFLQKEWFDKNCSRTVSEMMAFTAKHFFELGVNASNPLTWEDIKLIWTIGDEIPYMPEEDFFKELLKRFKAQKGEKYDRQPTEKNTNAY